METTLYIALAYLFGVLVAFIIILAINYDEANGDALSFIPHKEAWYSWAFVLFCLHVFIETWRNR